MNQKFAERIKQYLDSECSDYSLTYKWEWNEDCNCCEVTILRDDYTQHSKTISFKYDQEKDDLKIELCEGHFLATREFDHTVKYFWMLISPSIFPEA